MAFPVRLCALVGRFSDPRVAESVNALIPHLLFREVKVIVSDETPYSGDTAGIVRMPEKDIGPNADLVIAIGGDGTEMLADVLKPDQRHDRFLAAAGLPVSSRLPFRLARARAPNSALS